MKTKSAWNQENLVRKIGAGVGLSSPQEKSAALNIENVYIDSVDGYIDIVYLINSRKLMSLFLFCSGTKWA